MLANGSSRSLASLLPWTLEGRIKPFLMIQKICISLREKIRQNSGAFKVYNLKKLIWYLGKLKGRLRLSLPLFYLSQIPGSTWPFTWQGPESPTWFHSQPCILQDTWASNANLGSAVLVVSRLWTSCLTKPFSSNLIFVMVFITSAESKNEHMH